MDKESIVFGRLFVFLICDLLETVEVITAVVVWFIFREVCCSWVRLGLFLLVFIC